MVAWIIWFIISLIPALIVFFGKFSMQTLAMLYFLLVIGVVIGWGIYGKIKKRAPEEI